MAITRNLFYIKGIQLFINRLLIITSNEAGYEEIAMDLPFQFAKFNH